MLRINRWLTMLLLVALLASACQPFQLAVPDAAFMPEPSAQGSVPQPHGLRPDAPEYAKHGPFSVGYRALVIGEGSDHPLQAGLWYPALNPNGIEEKITYTINTKIPVEGMEASAPVYGHALLDAEIDASAAPYPLVIYSHGFASNAAWVHRLLEHYASYGFMVLAPEHIEQFDFDWSELPNSSIDRPLDIKQVLDYAERSAASGGGLAGLLDMQHVAVIGTSYGGYTALAMAGAQYDLDAFHARCAGLALDDPNMFYCDLFIPQEAEMAARAGLDPMPEGLWPSFVDPRVTAIIPLAGDAYLFDQAGLAKITVPMMAIGGTADTGTPYNWGSRPAYDYASSSRKTLVTFEGGEHFIMVSCESMPWWSETPFYNWVCFDPVWDKDRSIDLVNHFSTAFLLTELKGDADASKALAAENVNFPGIQYETTAYATATGEAAATAPVTGYAEVNGTRLYYEMAGAGEPIVMIHGMGWDTRSWDAQFAEFASQYQVVRYDMRGFGKSDKPTDQPYAHADDLKALMDYLSIDAAHVFGHSFGGEIAINFALAYPEATRALVLIEPDIQGAQGLPAMTPEEDASFAAAFAALEKGDRVGAALAIVDLNPLLVVAKDVPHVREWILGAFTDYEWFQFLNEDPVVQPTIPSAERIGEITAPTLLIVGDSTTEFQKIEVERLAEQMPNAQTVLFENSDHFPHLLYPEKFNRMVFDFLASLVATVPAPEPVAGEAASPSGLGEAAVSQIESLVVGMMARNQLPGFALGVVKDGALVYAQGFGVTSLDSGEAVTPQTLFQWAETSMSVTALAVLQLVEEGKIDLDAPVTAYLPYFQMQDEGYKEITVAQLLTHRSGIPDSGDAMADWETLMPEYDAGAAERWVRTALAEKGLLFAPGSNFEYSDLGYALLGPVIAAASGQTYEDYVSEHIFAPLDMSHSTFLLEEVDRTLLAMPHGPDATGDGMVSVALPYHRPFAATNNLFTSIEEMAKLAQAYLNHGELNDQRILPESVIAQMWQPQSPTPYADFAFGQLYPSPMMIDWGYGWFLGDIDGYVSPNAFGREFGFHAGTVLVPEAGLAVIAIGNGAVTNEYYAHDTATDVMAIVLEEIKSK